MRAKSAEAERESNSAANHKVRQFAQIAGDYGRLAIIGISTLVEKHATGCRS